MSVSVNKEFIDNQALRFLQNDEVQKEFENTNSLYKHTILENRSAMLNKSAVEASPEYQKEIQNKKLAKKVLKYTAIVLAVIAVVAIVALTTAMPASIASWGALFAFIDSLVVLKALAVIGTVAAVTSIAAGAAFKGIDMVKFDNEACAARYSKDLELSAERICDYSDNFKTFVMNQMKDEEVQASYNAFLQSKNITDETQKTNVALLKISIANAVSERFEAEAKNN